MLKPKPLLPGARIGIVAPSSPPNDPRDIDRGINALTDLGLKIKEGASLRARKGYLAGSDDARARDINRMFADKSIDAIFCLRGGYGGARILDLLDYTCIKRNPKIFCGFSDITALHLAILQKTRLCTFHGPTVLSGFAKDKNSAFTVSSLLKSICDPHPPGDISLGLPKAQRSTTIIQKGIARGSLIGGNLAIITSLIGTKFLPSMRGSILFLEDVNEPLYKIDRMLTQLIMSGILKGVRGIALGQWAGCSDPKGKGELVHLFKDRLGALKIPVLLGLPFGHIDEYATIPYGVKAELNTNARSLVVLESPTR